MDSNQIKIKAEQERQRLKKLRDRSDKGSKAIVNTPGIWTRVKNRFNERSRFESPLAFFGIFGLVFVYFYWTDEQDWELYTSLVLLGLSFVSFIFLIIDKLRKGNRSKLFKQMEVAIDTVESISKPTQQEVVPVEKMAYPANGFYVFRKIYPPTYNGFTWFFLVPIPGVLCFYFWLWEDAASWVLLAGIGMICLSPIRLLIEYLKKIYGYKTYKNFQEHLGFELTGWDKIGSDSDLFKPFYWTECSIEIVLKEGAAEAETKLVNDALYLLTVNTYKWHYEGSFGMDGRKKWAQQSDLVAGGSVCRFTIGEVYQFIEGPLKSIQHKYSNIELVKVKIGDNFFEAKRKYRGKYQ